MTQQQLDQIKNMDCDCGDDSYQNGYYQALEDVLAILTDIPTLTDKVED